MNPSDIIDALTKYPRGAEACGLRQLTPAYVWRWRDAELSPRYKLHTRTILGIVVERADDMGVEVVWRLAYTHAVDAINEGWFFEEPSMRATAFPTRLHALLAGIEASDQIDPPKEQP